MRLLAGLALALYLLGGCSSPPQAPVEDRTGRIVAGDVVPESYSVKRGDTLYGIAWRYALDHKRLAANNGIAYPYTIYPGQKLALKGKAAGVKTSSASSSRSSSSTSSASTSSGSTASGSSNKPKTSAPKPIAAPAPVRGSVVTFWRWPSSGKVVRGFSGELHKGIDIAGKSGDPVRAVAPGRVVYAGNGIVGYGNLLIVKHNETYLSAYGHNRRLLVEEGAQVKAGQQLAEMGSGATNSVKLHFEIRRDGTPIDPRKLLPKQP